MRLGTPYSNLMPLLVEAGRADTTEGEIIETLQSVWGSYKDTPMF